MLNFERKTMYRELDAETFYESRDTGDRYRRIVGGLAWPGTKKPGFAVIVGEEKRHDFELNAYHLRLLAEVEEVNLERLLEWCIGYEVNSPEVHWSWYGDTNNKPAMAWVYRLNDKYPNQGMRRFLSLVPAPHIDSPRRFEFCVNILRERLEQWRKTLHFGEESGLPNYLLQLGSEGITKPAGEDYPAIAALGYAISALTIWSDAGLPY